MDLSTSLQAVKNAIADDDSTATWANLYYGQDHMVYLGTNPEDQPDEEKYPVVAIYPDNIASGWDSEDKTERMIVVVSLNEDDLEETARNNEETLEAVLRLCAFTKMVFDVIKAINFGPGAYIKSASVDYEATLWPYMMSAIDFTVSYPLDQGSDPFA